MMRVFVDGIGVVAPGLNGWAASVPILSGNTEYAAAPLAIPVLEILPPAERRRTPIVVKLAIAAGCEALANAGQPAAETASVFTSSGGDGDVIHQICDSLAQPEREVSPTRFHNSVHNAPAGYWGIATGAREPSTSLCAFDASFAAGLIEAATQVCVDGRKVLLVAYDAPYPEPINGVRRIGAGVGIALLLSPQQSAQSLSEIEISLVSIAMPVNKMVQPDLENFRVTVPAARALPLLARIAKNDRGSIVMEYLGENALQASIKPCK
jgi:Beta-ketoacyl synthase, N-terminal domain